MKPQSRKNGFLSVAPDEPILSDAARVKIGEHLKKAYDDVVNEPVPDRFTALLDDLEAAEKKGVGNDSR